VFVLPESLGLVLVFLNQLAFFARSFLDGGSEFLDCQFAIVLAEGVFNLGVFGGMAE